MRFEVPLALLAMLCAAALACEPAPLGDDDELFVPVAPVVCNANADGRIERDELPFAVGAVARVRVGLNVPVDVDGEPGQPSGQGSARVWDLSRPEPASEPVGLLELEPLETQWFASEFPDGDVAGPLEPGNGTLGPLALDDDAIRLLGAASKDENPESGGRTFMKYEEPVVLYPFPLEVGASATTTTRALNALAAGIPLSVEDTYAVSVTAHGQVVLPDLILDDAIRVTLRLQRIPVAGFAVQQVTHVWLNECVGEVARMKSPFVALDEELPDDFDIAAEVWRLGF